MSANLKMRNAASHLRATIKDSLTVQPKQEAARRISVVKHSLTTDEEAAVRALSEDRGFASERTRNTISHLNMMRNAASHMSVAIQCAPAAIPSPAAAPSRACVVPHQEKNVEALI